MDYCQSSKQTDTIGISRFAVDTAQKIENPFSAIMPQMAWPTSEQFLS
jgi:hypothetical protein